MMRIASSAGASSSGRSAGSPPDGNYDKLLRASADWPAGKRGWAERAVLFLTSQQLRYGVLGIVVFFVTWYVLTAVIVPPRFNVIPDPVSLFSEWINRDPAYGISIFTPEYYEHILISVRRVCLAFLAAIGLGVPLGLVLGWSKTCENIILPVVELLRPIPPLAWVPLAVLAIPSTEGAVIFITLLASFFATVLNTLFGVKSIDESYFRAAACLGYSRWQVLKRVVIPGALPFVFTGLQIAMGVAWFSLVGGELIAGRSGLGYLIFDAYTNVALPNIFIGMITLGMLGYISSAIIRSVGNRLNRWNTKGGL